MFLSTQLLPDQSSKIHATWEATFRKREAFVFDTAETDFIASLNGQSLWIRRYWCHLRAIPMHFTSAAGQIVSCIPAIRVFDRRDSAVEELS